MINNNIITTKTTPKIHLQQANEIMDEEYVAFLLLESLYKSGKINKPTYENVLKEKRKYIEKKYNIKDVTV